MQWSLAAKSVNKKARRPRGLHVSSSRMTHFLFQAHYCPWGADFYNFGLYKVAKSVFLVKKIHKPNSVFLEDYMCRPRGLHVSFSRTTHFLFQAHYYPWGANFSNFGIHKDSWVAFRFLARNFINKKVCHPRGLNVSSLRRTHFLFHARYCPWGVNLSNCGFHKVAKSVDF